MKRKPVPTKKDRKASIITVPNAKASPAIHRGMVFSGMQSGLPQTEGEALDVFRRCCAEKLVPAFRDRMSRGFKLPDLVGIVYDEDESGLISVVTRLHTEVDDIDGRLGVLLAQARENAPGPGKAWAVMYLTLSNGDDVFSIDQVLVS